MQPIKIVIPGKFYDSFIYNKNLILWDINGDIIKIDWDFFIIDFLKITMINLLIIVHLYMEIICMETGGD